MESDPTPEAEAESEAEVEAEGVAEIGEYGRRLAVALRDAVLHLREKGMLEIPDAVLDVVVVQCAQAGLEARSPKQVIKRVIKALMASDEVEEVFGTDDELADALRSFLGA